MEFNFSLTKNQSEDIYIPKELELWAPLEERPSLNEKEMKTILHNDDVIESLHIAIPSFLVNSENEEFGYYPCFELERYFLVGKLKQSPYIIFYEEKRSSKVMQKKIREGFLLNRSNYYLFDAFYDPIFGGASPKHYLFQRVTFESVPDVMILFKDVELESSSLSQLFME
ncbi:MAG: hypothetical protein FJZ59_03195 [Chlamydiae bacterium]|nr:hypothetical protein [Chlamydiota bacterium]